jgi:hypothetical protein
MIQEQQPKNLMVKNQQAALAVHTQESASGVLPQDFIVPYMVITQSMSEAFTQKKADTGDIIRSTNFDKMGDVDHPVDIVILSKPSNMWIEEERPKAGQRFEFRKQYHRDAANDIQPWSFWMKDEAEVPEGTKGATEWRRVKIMKFFALTLKDLENDAVEMAKAASGELPDLNNVLMPVVVSFRSTSYKAGKSIGNILNRAASVQTPAYLYYFSLAPQSETNDQGTFYVWTVNEKTKAVPVEYRDKVSMWAKIVNSGQTILTDDQALNESEAPQREAREVVNQVV